MENNTTIFAKKALLPDGWADNVRISVDTEGLIQNIEIGTTHDLTKDSDELEALLPGIGNLHSHAFQISMRGLAQKRSSESESDDFWTWRETMYDFANRVTPDQMQALTTFLYAEMLKTGYTGIAEFHYLHHQSGGEPYPKKTEMSDRIIAAAEDVGLAITHLPMAYAHGGFGSEDANERQKLFLNNSEEYLALVTKLQEKHGDKPNVTIGQGFHSLRAVSPEIISDVLTSDVVTTSDTPVHIHISEQTAEIEASIEWSGKRPIEWLLDFLDNEVPDFDQKRLTFIHATHMTDEETLEVAKRGICIGFCPTTEADLGDGISQAKLYMEKEGSWGVGSDQNGTIAPYTELYLLEAGQRLQHKGRIVLGDGDFLYQQAVTGGAQALGMNTGSIEIGKRADLVSLNLQQMPSMYGKKPEQILDTIILSPAPVNPVQHVWVNGINVVIDGQLQSPQTRGKVDIQPNIRNSKSEEYEARIRHDFETVLAELQNVDLPVQPSSTDESSIAIN